MNAIMRRRSSRKYLDQPVEKEKLESILRAAMQSPTGHNAQGWDFVIVTDPGMRKDISKMGPWSAFSADAPMLIVVCADMEKQWQEAALWPSDMGAVCQTILIQAEEEGLGACWMGVWPHEDRMVYLRPCLGLPESVVPYAVISLGYKQFEKKFDDRYDESKIHWGKW